MISEDAMPSVILSHQAPGVLLKIAFPKYIDGTAVCIAATVPDFELVFYRCAQLLADKEHPWQWGLSHNLLGLVVVALPVSILGTFVFSRWIAPPLAEFASGKSRLSNLLRYFGIDQWVCLRNKKFSGMQFVVILYSALAGGISHFVLDAFTHRGMHLLYPLSSRMLFQFENTRFLDFGEVSIGALKYGLYLDSARTAWITVSLVTGIATLWGLRYMTKKNLWK